MSVTVPADVLGMLRQVIADWKNTPAYRKLLEPRDGIFARFQPVFSSEHVAKITEDEFKPFLLDKVNRHWSGLHRSGNRLCSDMGALRKALGLLLDESQPLARRMDKATETVSGMGKNIASAVLTVAYPERYGVWNNRSEARMKRLGIWPEFAWGDSLGSRYATVNALLLQLRNALEIDLWTLDYLWWHLDELEEGVEPDDEGESGESLASIGEGEGQGFGLERHLHEFLRDNWERTALGKEWALYGEPGDENPGYEYPCDVGRIDLLAKHRKKPQWLVVELKRGQTSDVTVGQVLRYMGWVRNHLAADGDEVRGLVIARDADDALRYALSNLPSVDLQLYEVEFRLKDAPKLQKGQASVSGDGK